MTVRRVSYLLSRDHELRFDVVSADPLAAPSAMFVGVVTYHGDTSENVAHRMRLLEAEWHRLNDLMASLGAEDHPE